MNDLTAFQRDILYIVTKKERQHGLAIKKVLDEYYETETNHGRLYPNLDKLVERGLLNKTEKDGRTNAYSITQAGLQKLKQRREWERQFLEDEQLSEPASR